MRENNAAIENKMKNRKWVVEHSSLTMEVAVLVRTGVFGTVITLPPSVAHTGTPILIKGLGAVAGAPVGAGV